MIFTTTTIIPVIQVRACGMVLRDSTLAGLYLIPDIPVNRPPEPGSTSNLSWCHDFLSGVLLSRTMSARRAIKVAIVGSGLAGLSAAYLLTKSRIESEDVEFEVHIFEKVSL